MKRIFEIELPGDVYAERIGAAIEFREDRLFSHQIKVTDVTDTMEQLQRNVEKLEFVQIGTAKVSHQMVPAYVKAWEDQLTAAREREEKAALVISQTFDSARAGTKLCDMAMEWLCAFHPDRATGPNEEPALSVCCGEVEDDRLPGICRKCRDHTTFEKEGA